MTNTDLVWKILRECDLLIYSSSFVTSTQLFVSLHSIRKHAGTLYMRLAESDRHGDSVDGEDNS